MLRWSYSTDAVLRRCHRQLAFGQVVASHNARDPRRREAYIRRQLHSVASWQGSLVHSIMSTAVLADLRANRPIAPLALAAAAHDLAERQFAFSAARRYREPGMTKAKAGDAYCALLAHERGEDVGTAPLRAVEENVILCFTHLAGQHELLARLYAGYEHVAELPLSLRAGRVTIAATPDLLVSGYDGALTIVDWKVSRGTTSRYAPQLQLYALMALESGRWRGLPPERINLYEVNLLDDRVYHHRVGDDELAATVAYMRDGVAALERVLGDGSYAHLDLDALAIADEPAACASCVFAPLCIDKLVATGRDEDATTVSARLPSRAAGHNDTGSVIQSP